MSVYARESRGPDRHRQSQEPAHSRQKGSLVKDAKELLQEFTAASFRDPKKAAEMFAEDGAFEMHYLESFGVTGRYQGREAIEAFFRFVRGVFPDGLADYEAPPERALS